VRQKVTLKYKALRPGREETGRPGKKEVPQEAKNIGEGKGEAIDEENPLQ